MLSFVRPALALVLLLSGADTLLAQHHGGHGVREHAPPQAQSREAQGPFAVRSFGSYRSMIRGRDYAPKMVLGELETLGATDAVGAVSDLRGEITMIDGRLVVSYGGGCAGCPPARAERATFLGVGKVAEWGKPVPLPADLSGRALDEFILAQTKEAGLDLAAPFPVRLRGTLTGVQMHVIEAPNPAFAGHGSGVPMAKQDEYRHATLAGDVVGLYAPAPMQGVLTHPGEPFHYHWVDAERTRTAHLDAFGMQRGAELMLPQR